MAEREVSVVGRVAALHEECGKAIDDANAFLVDQGQSRFADEVARPLRLALMGQYNAGKSTLVNALLGSNAAETGDAPETQLAHTYSRDGFEVVDLPGGDARAQEHELARNALVDAHAVLYVVSSQTGLDYATFWTDLKWLEDGHFPYFIVINDKQAHEDEQEEQQARERLLGRFTVEAQGKLREHHGRVFWVNARRAMDGRLRGRAVLVEKSGVTALEMVLEDVLRRSEPLLRDRRRLAECVGALRLAMSGLDEKLADPRERLLSRLIERVDETRDRLTATASAIADDQFGSLGDLIASQLTRTVEAKDSERAQATEEVSQTLKGTFTVAAEAFEKECSAQFKRLAAEAQDELGGGAIDRNLDVTLGSVPGVSPADFDIMGILRSVGRQGGGKAFVDFAKASTESAFETTGKSAAKRAGQIVSGVVLVAFAAVDIYQGYRAAEKQRGAVSAATKEIEVRARQAATMARQQFVSRASSYVADELDALNRSLRERLEIESGDARVARKAFARASAFKAKIDALLVAIGELTN